MTDPLDNNAQAIINAARASSDPTYFDLDKPVGLVIPSDAQLVQPDLHAWRSQPTRTRGTYCFSTAESLIDYVSRHANGDTTVWVDPGGKVTALIDDSGVGMEAAAWREHRALLTLEETPEWTHWLGGDGEMMSQEKFAEHIETGLDEIIEPDGATMLELAQNFHATTGATFRSSTRLASGEQRLQYDEEVKATAGAAGDLTVPTRFLLGISPYTGEDPYKLAARLRFRVTSGRLTLGYLLDKPEAVRRDAIETIAQRLREHFAHTYVGTPAP